VKKMLKNILLYGGFNALNGYTEQIADSSGLYADAVACQEALRQNGVKSGVVGGITSGFVVVRPEDKETAERLLAGGMKR
jgi:hypothetical protein